MKMGSLPTPTFRLGIPRRPTDHHQVGDTTPPQGLSSGWGYHGTPRIIIRLGIPRRPTDHHQVGDTTPPHGLSSGWGYHGTPRIIIRLGIPRHQNVHSSPNLKVGACLINHHHQTFQIFPFGMVNIYRVIFGLGELFEDTNIAFTFCGS